MWAQSFNSFPVIPFQSIFRLLKSQRLYICAFWVLHLGYLKLRSVAFWVEIWQFHVVWVLLEVRTGIFTVALLVQCYCSRKQHTTSTTMPIKSVQIAPVSFKMQGVRHPPRPTSECNFITNDKLDNIQRHYMVGYIRLHTRMMWGK